MRFDSYAACESTLGERSSRKVDHNIYLRREGDSFVVRLHSTDIVIHHSDGTITLDSGGWQTVTTFDRMNKALPRPYSICRTKGIAEIWRHGATVRGTDRGTWKGGDHTFADGMRFDPETNRIITTGTKRTGTDPKDIAAFLKYATSPIIAQRIQTEGVTAGDCFYCLMVGVDDGVPWGESTRDMEHLRSHIAERYVPGALIHNAFRNYGNPQFAASHALECAAMGNPEMLRMALGHYIKRCFEIERIAV